ncbi:hypothetical protein PR048_010398 [Dryococelus australis]|uniref:Uncharacterized protein n=1 Tax=Dryococelus australis TaxID=614101 RepID=A0ABQ9I3Q5_9NEOP|nr:hypothetical protein PR048_010398 [Dryococelus australis]
MPLLGGISRGYQVSPALSFQRCSILTSITLIGSQDLDVKRRPNLFTSLRCLYYSARQPPGLTWFLAAVRRFYGTVTDLTARTTLPPVRYADNTVSCADVHSAHTARATYTTTVFARQVCRYRGGSWLYLSVLGNGLRTALLKRNAVDTPSTGVFCGLARQDITFIRATVRGQTVEQIDITDSSLECNGCCERVRIGCSAGWQARYQVLIGLWRCAVLLDSDVISLACAVGDQSNYSCAPWGRGGVVSRLLAFHIGKTDSIPGGATPGFSHVGIVPDDAAGRRVFSGISFFPDPFIPALLHTDLSSPCSQDVDVKTISPLTVRPGLRTHT